MAAPNVTLPDWGPNPNTGFDAPASVEEVEQVVADLFDALGWLAHEDNPFWNQAIHQARHNYQQWLALHDNYLSGFIGSAEGNQLNALMHFLLERKRAAQPGFVWAVATGEPGAELQPGDVTFTAVNGQSFTLHEATFLNAQGEGDLLFKADDVGKQGTLATHAIASFDGVDALDNPPLADTSTRLNLVPDLNPTAWTVVPDDASGVFFQEVRAADVTHPSSVRELHIVARNGDGSLTENEATIRLDVYDENSVFLAATERLTVMLDDTGETLRFVGHDLNWTQIDTAQISPVVEASDGDVEVGVVPASDAGVYDNGNLIDGSTVTGDTLAMRLVSALNGEGFGGRDAEDDAEALARYRQIIEAPGFAQPGAIRAWLLKLPQVRDAVVRFNPFDFTWKGIPKKSMHVVVDGGFASDIAQTIWRRSWGLRTFGSRRFPIEEPGGNWTHPISYDVAERLKMAARVTIQPKPGWNNKRDAPVVRDAVVRYIGGPDRERTLAPGLGIGDIVDREGIAFQIRQDLPDADRKIRDLDIELAKAGEALVADDVEDVALRQRPWTTLDDVEVKV